VQNFARESRWLTSYNLLLRRVWLRARVFLLALFMQRSGVIEDNTSQATLRITEILRMRLFLGSFL